MSGEVTVVRVEGGWECELVERGLRARLRLAEANGTLSVADVSLTSDSGEGIAASSLSRAPYAKWIRAAKDAVGHQRPRGRLKRASDLYVMAFLEDGRGKAARSDEDYANLAWLYVMRGESAHSLARDLATRHGGSIQTWRNRLSRAKRFTAMVEEFDDDGRVQQVRRLTDDAMRLIFGDDWIAEFEHQAMQDRDLEGAMRFIQLREAPASDAERARVAVEDSRRSPEELRHLMERARRIVETAYSGRA